MQQAHHFYEKSERAEQKHCGNGGKPQSMDCEKGHGDAYQPHDAAVEEGREFAVAAGGESRKYHHNEHPQGNFDRKHPNDLHGQCACGRILQVEQRDHRARKDYDDACRNGPPETIFL